MITIEPNTQNEIFETLYADSFDIIKQKVSTINICPSTLHLILKYVMEEVESTPIKGVQQKEFALKLIRELITDLTDKEDEETLLKLLDNGTISNIIDLIVDASNGKLNINTTIEVAKGCFTICLPYLFSVIAKKKSNQIK
jgi:hypothetical protein